MKKLLTLALALMMAFAVMMALPVAAAEYEAGATFAIDPDEFAKGNPEFGPFQLMQYNPNDDEYKLLVWNGTSQYEGEWAYCIIADGGTGWHPNDLLNPVIAFTAPVSGTYKLSCILQRLSPVNGTGSRIWTALNGQTVKEVVIENTLPNPYEATFDMKKGETVYFGYDPINNTNADDYLVFQGLTYTLTEVKADAPATEESGGDDEQAPETADFAVGVVALAVVAAACVVVAKKKMF